MAPRRDPHTLDPLAWEPPKVAVAYGADVAGRGMLDNRIKRVISRALKDAKDNGQSRAKVAAGISEFLGRTVTEDMLNKWASEAADSHRMTLDVFIALMDVTGVLEPLNFVASQFGLVAVPEKYHDLIKLKLVDDYIEEATRLQQVLHAKVRAGR